MKFYFPSSCFVVAIVIPSSRHHQVHAANELNGDFSHLFESSITTDDEYDMYGCDDPDTSSTMVACFCGLLKDRIDDVSELTGMESAQQGASPCVNGNAAGYPCKNVDLQSHIPLSTFGSGKGNDVWGWTDVTTGREFALMGLNDGTGFVEITIPDSPTYLGKLPTATSNSSWRDIKVYNDYAFIVSEAQNHGMQVFDLSQLLNVVNPPISFSSTAYYNDGVGNAHNIAINEDTGRAYIVGGSNGCNGGLHIVDIANPTNPTKVGCFGGDGYVHDTHCVLYNGPDANYSGREVCFGCNEDTVTIVDVSNPSSGVELSKTPYNSRGTFFRFVVVGVCITQNLTSIHFAFFFLTTL